MALVLKDRVKETSTTTGTGSLTLGGAVTGYQSFSSAIGNGNTTYYAIYLDGGSEWEVGLGTVSAGALARTTVLASSNGGSLVNFSAGQKSVWGDYPAGKAVYADASNVVNVATLNASSNVISSYFDASGSAGGALRNASGTNQIQWGAGGGNNVTVDVSTNLNGTNAQIDISPTGTGHVHIKPTGSGSLEIAPTAVGTIDNMAIGGTTKASGSFTTLSSNGNTSFSGADCSISIQPTGTGVVYVNPATTGAIDNMNIGATTPKNGSFVDLSVTGTTSFDGSQGTSGQVLTSQGSGNTPIWTTPTTGTVTSVTATAPVASTGGTTPVISMAAASSTTNGYLTSTDWNTFNNKGSGTVTSVSGTAPISSSGGATPAISISQATTSTNGYLSSTDWNTFNNKATLPSQTGNSGKYLTTDGTNTSWGALPTYIPVTNRATSIIQVSVAYGYMPILTRGGTTTNVPTL